MVSTETTEQEEYSFHCAHCENSFPNSQSHPMNGNTKIWLKNLPSKISESGLRNLFVTVGDPIKVQYYLSRNSALVEFDCWRKCELAIRDLHCMPPYYITVTQLTNKTNDPAENEGSENWDFSDSQENISENGYETEEENELAISTLSPKIITELGYDPSVRIRQKKLDFITDFECVSMGRGYINMGNVNRYIGGLQTFTLSSENSEAKKKPIFTCLNCNAPTFKRCFFCLKVYCSEYCLSQSTIDHQGNCAGLSENDEIQPEDETDSESNFDQQDVNQDSLAPMCLDTKLTLHCTVIISTYLTMKSVFIRKSNNEWEKNFVRFCNEVAEMALKADKLESIPKIGELYIAKYYKDHCFYRAKVTLIDEKTAEVVFIDFGNSQKTNFDDLKPLPNHLKSVPELAVKVHLSNVAEGSSLESVDFYNKLTAKMIPLTLEFHKKSRKVTLKVKHLKTITVNKTASKCILPSWKRCRSENPKLGEVLFKNSIETETLEIGQTYSFILSHFDKEEFIKSNIFWVKLPDTDNFFHINTEMHSRITEYCRFLKNDYYLPRVNELCLVREEGKWHRAVNLGSQGTICYVFFLDDGHSSYIKTSDIRKMIQDFTEVAAQAICCTISVDSKFKADKELNSKITDYLKAHVKKRIDSVKVVNQLGDAYRLLIPEIEKKLA